MHQNEGISSQPHPTDFVEDDTVGTVIYCIGARIGKEWKRWSAQILSVWYFFDKPKRTEDSRAETARIVAEKALV